ncbi:MAG: hypothetical protein GF368_03345 [Candidatus Aenigmarchaeota archaeon]|nr:hypothetical protein [Candidatus Aenigmarchaeota archaeon]
MGLFKDHGIDPNYAGEAIENRWWRNPFYKDKCRRSGIKGPEMLHEMIDSGDLAGIPVVSDTDAKMLVEEDDDGVKMGGKTLELTGGLIENIPPSETLYMDTSSGEDNPDCVFRTEEEVNTITENYGRTFQRPGRTTWDHLISFFPSLSSLERSETKAYGRARKAGLLPNDRKVIPRRQARSGLLAATEMCEDTETTLLRHILPITILNSTILRPWKHGAAHVIPDYQRTIEFLRGLEDSDLNALWGASPILMYLFMKRIHEKETFDFNGRLDIHGGGGGYRGVKGGLRIKGGIDQEVYIDMMRYSFGVYPSETYGYTGQTHAIKLRWNPERTWADSDRGGEERIGAYEARIPEDVEGNAIVYAFNPLKGEVVEEGPGLVRALNFDGGHAQFDGAMQVYDRVYVNKKGIIFGIRGLGSKYGC